MCGDFLPSEGVRERAPTYSPCLPLVELAPRKGRARGCHLHSRPSSAQRPQHDHDKTPRFWYDDNASQSDGSGNVCPQRKRTGRPFVCTKPRLCEQRDHGAAFARVPPGARSAGRRGCERGTRVAALRGGQLPARHVGAPCRCVRVRQRQNPRERRGWRGGPTRAGCAPQTRRAHASLDVREPCAARRAGGTTPLASTHGRALTPREHIQSHLCRHAQACRLPSPHRPHQHSTRDNQLASLRAAANRRLTTGGTSVVHRRKRSSDASAGLEAQPSRPRARRQLPLFVVCWTKDLRGVLAQRALSLPSTGSTQKRVLCPPWSTPSRNGNGNRSCSSRSFCHA